MEFFLCFYLLNLPPWNNLIIIRFLDFIRLTKYFLVYKHDSIKEALFEWVQVLFDNYTSSILHFLVNGHELFLQLHFPEKICPTDPHNTRICKCSEIYYNYFRWFPVPLIRSASWSDFQIVKIWWETICEIAK